MTRPRSTYTYPPIAVSAAGGSFRLVAGPSSLLDQAAPESVATAPRGALGWAKRAFGDLLSGDSHACAVWERECGYRTGRDVLRWRRELDAACPWAGWIDEDGTAAVLHADDELRFFAPNGETPGSVNVLAVLQADPAARTKLVRSTAGIHWAEHPLGTFAPSPRGSRFCLCLPHGQRVLFDPAAAQRVDEELTADALARERHWVVRSLAEAVARGDLGVAGAYAILAGREGIHDAVPSLLALERAASSPSSWRSDEVWSYPCSMPRARAQHALARLDVDHEPSSAFGALDAPRPAGWREALTALPTGLCAKEYVDRVGAPSFIGLVGEEWVWEYDVRGEHGYETVRLCWKGKTLARVERRTPPPWRTEDYRDTGA